MLRLPEVAPEPSTAAGAEASSRNTTLLLLHRRPHRVPPAGLTQGPASWFQLELSHRCSAMGLPWMEAEGLGLGAWPSIFGSVAATGQLTSLSFSFPICVMSCRDPLENLNQRTQHKLCMPSTQFCPFLPRCSRLEGGTLSTMPLASFLLGRKPGLQGRVASEVWECERRGPAVSFPGLGEKCRITWAP